MITRTSIRSVIAFAVFAMGAFVATPGAVPVGAQDAAPRALEVSYDARARSIAITNPCNAGGEPPQQSTYDLWIEGSDGVRVQLATAKDPFVMDEPGLTAVYSLPADTPDGPATVELLCQRGPITIELPRDRFVATIQLADPPPPSTEPAPAAPVSGIADYTG